MPDPRFLPGPFYGTAKDDVVRSFTETMVQYVKDMGYERLVDGRVQTVDPLDAQRAADRREAARREADLMNFDTYIGKTLGEKRLAYETIRQLMGQRDPRECSTSAGDRRAENTTSSLGGTSTMSNVTVNVSRTKLLEQLKAKKDQTIAYLDGLVEELKVRREALDLPREIAWAAYHLAVAEGLNSGDLKFDERHGRVVAKRGKFMPEQPGVESKEGYDHYIEILGEGGGDRKSTVGDLERVISILEISDDKTLEVSTSNDFGRLLNAQVGNRYSFENGGPLRW